MAFRLQLLGPPRVTSGGTRSEPVTELGADRPVSLLYYLAQRNDWVSRSELAFLYRPDADDLAALSNVRKLIHRAREYPWADTLEAEKHRVRFLIETDVQAFRQAILEGRWSDALRLHHGPFLDGVRLADVPGFEAWLELERADLTRLWQQGARQHAQDLEQQQDWPGTTEVLRMLLKADPFDEDALQIYLRALNAQGQRRQALEVFETFCRELKRELDAEPLEATRAVVDRLRQTTPDTTAASADRTAPRHNLPAPTTRFIGRKRELARLTEVLGQADARLITLIGLGGTGKTRLSLELAWQQLETFPDGVWFVSLAGLTSSDLIVPGIASALGFGFAGPREPREQLLDYLREKTLLLVLDNFEHLLEATGVVDELLGAAPGLKIIATSRAALELSSEWLFDVDGLSYPPRDTEDDPEGFDAVRLFLSRAERVSTAFMPSRDVLLAVADICRKVEGLPLALELAATWTRSLSVSQIAQQLEAGLALLSTRQRDVPERHRSMRAVFDHSWAQLGRFEQEALARLSVFQDGFTLGAAGEVAGAHLPLLLSLINHSLVRRGSDGRFGLHELVRQLANEHLGNDQNDLCMEGLSRYFTAFLRAREERIKGANQRAVLDEIEADWGNILHVWNWGLNQRRWPQIEAMLSCLNSRFELKSSYREGAAIFGGALDVARQAFAAITPEPEILGKLLTLSAYFRCRLGETDEPEHLIQQAIRILTLYPESKFNAFATFVKGLIRHTNGHYDEASEVYQHALELYRTHGNFWAVSRICNHLGTIAWNLADLERAKNWHRLALENSRRMGDTREVATSLNGLGVALESSGEIEESISLYRESLNLYSEVGFVRGQAFVLNNLGHVYERQGDFMNARKHYEQSLELKKVLGNPASVASTLTNLADVLFELGETRAALDMNLEALSFTVQAKASPVALRVVWSFARMYARINQTQDALRLARFIMTFEACEQWVRDEAAAHLAEWEKATDATRHPRVERSSSQPTLDWVTAWLIERHRTTESPVESAPELAPESALSG